MNRRKIHARCHLSLLATAALQLFACGNLLQHQVPQPAASQFRSGTIDRVETGSGGSATSPPVSDDKTATLADDPIVDYKVVTHADGSWHYEWIHKSQRDKADSHKNKDVNKRNGSIPEEDRKKARKFIEDNGSALRDDALRNLGTVIHEGIDDVKGLSALDAAKVLSESEWKRFANDSACTAADGCTKNGDIYIRRNFLDSPNASSADVVGLLSHETIHSILQSADPHMSPAKQEGFIKGFVGTHK